MTDTSENVIFADYCNICCRTDQQQLKNISKNNDLKETILCLTGHKDAFIGNDIYLCFSCCEFLEHCYKFKQMCLINLVRVRQIYFEINKLELQENEPAAKLLKEALHAKMMKNIDNIKHNYSVTLSQVNNENQTEKNSTSDQKSNLDNDVVSKLNDDVSIIIPKRVEKTVEDSNVRNIDNIEQNSSDTLHKKNGKDKTKIKSSTKTENNLSNDEIRKLSDDVSLVIQRDVDINVENATENDVENIVCDVNPEYKFDESNELFESDDDEKVTYDDINVGNEVDLIYVSDASNNKINIKQEDFGYKSESEAAQYEEEQSFHFLGEIFPIKPKSSNKSFFTCKWPMCGTIFENVSDLKLHRLTHKDSKNRPFACDWPGCKWKFIRKDHLNRHLRKHTADKPYGCTYCGRKFSRSDHMATHMKSVHSFTS